MRLPGTVAARLSLDLNRIRAFEQLITYQKFAEADPNSGFGQIIDTLPLSPSSGRRRTNERALSLARLSVLREGGREFSNERLHEEGTARRRNAHLHAKRLKL